MELKITQFRPPWEEGESFLTIISLHYYLDARSSLISSNSASTIVPS